MRFATARKMAASALCVLFACYAAAPAQAYSFGYTVGDMRIPATFSGGTACPQRDHWDLTLSSGINRQWSTSIGVNPPTIFTQDQSVDGQMNEIESAITESFGVWTGVSGSALTPASLAPISRIDDPNACVTDDGLNTICFSQDDPAFTTGVLSFTRVTTATIIGDQLVSNHAPPTSIGEIQDADILLNPTGIDAVFATPQALASNPQAFDLESILTHELGHFFGFEHSAVWSAAMFPFAPPPGAFLGPRPTSQAPDAPLAEDDRTGLRILYTSASDTTHVGSIRGRILPANPLSLTTQPGVTGIFAANVVAVDNSTGMIVAATQAGWSCTGVGPAVFDGSYALERLAVGTSQSYQIYVEPFTGPENSLDVAGTVSNLCHNSITEQDWPVQFSCTVPAITVNFMARIRPPN